MRRHALDLSLIWFGATLVLGYMLLSEPRWQSIIVRIYLLLLGALTLFALFSAATERGRREGGSPFDAALHRSRAKPEPLSELMRVNREVSLATATAYDFHFRLLPHLREIAQCRLERSGKTSGPDTLGRWWELLRADRPEPDDRFAPGIKQAELRALVSDLERMGR
jgi:hypothetical protein